MKKQTWTALFLIVLAVHLVAIAFTIRVVEYVSKPMIVALLGLYFYSQTEKTASGLKNWILGALVFSWVGDVVLLFQPNGSIFFLLGLSAFLIAHVFYIIFFHWVRVKEKVKSNFWLVLVVMVYYFALIFVLSPYLGEMKLPVRIYGVVISFMFMLAMHTLFIKNKIAGRYLVVGALLFVISDSVLAINKFYKPFEFAGVVIMLTYGLAQLGIIEGAIRYITSGDKE